MTSRRGGNDYGPSHVVCIRTRTREKEGRHGWTPGTGRGGRQNGSGHATTPAGGESGGRPHGPTRGGRSQTGLARSRTIRDFHGVPDGLREQTHAPDLTPNGGCLCSSRGKPPATA